MSTSPDMAGISYSTLQQFIAGCLILSLWGCATVPSPPKAGEPLRSTYTDTAVVGRLVLVRSSVDQTPYKSLADNALCFVPDGVVYEEAKKGVRAGTIELDGTFKALLPPGDYKLYSQHSMSKGDWLAVLPLVKLKVSKPNLDEINYAGTLRVDLDQTSQPRPVKAGRHDVRLVPVSVSDEMQQQAIGQGAATWQGVKVVPELLQVEANVAFVEPKSQRTPCTARQLFPEAAKDEDKNVAKGVLVGLLVLPLLAIVLVVGVVLSPGFGTIKIN
jgi:hypothetical protein